MRSLKLFGLSLALVAGLSGQVRASVYGYAYETTSNYTFTGAATSNINTSSNNTATLSGYPPANNLVTATGASADAPLAYIGNGSAGENQTAPQGQVNAPNTRGDSALIVGAAAGPGNLSSLVVAEGYLASPGNAAGNGKATISGNIVPTGTSVTLTFSYSNNLVVSNTTGSTANAIANYNYEFTISTVGTPTVPGVVVYDSAQDTTGNNNLVNLTVSEPTTGSFNQGVMTGTATFTATGLTAGTTYIATVTTQAGETLTINAVNVVPEPSTIAGLAMGVVGLIGYGLRRRGA